MKIAIMGCGKMGMWFANSLSKSNDVLVYDINKQKTQELLEKNKKLKSIDGLEQLNSFKPDLLINAVSLKNTFEAFDKVISFLPQNCIICDITSVKGNLKDFYLKNKIRFVSIHPMFGPSFTDMNLLKGQNAIIILESDDLAKEFFRNFFGEFKIQVFEFCFEEHDKMMAYSLTTPFVSSLVFASCVNNKSVPGTTFSKHLEISRKLLLEEDNLLTEILFNGESIKQIETITGRLEFLKHIIHSKDYIEAKRFFDNLRKNVN